MSFMHYQNSTTYFHRVCIQSDIVRKKLGFEARCYIIVIYLNVGYNIAIYLNVARCDRKTNGIELKRNSQVTGVGFTNNIVKKRFEFQITHTHKIKHATQERETVKQKKRRYLLAEKRLRPRERRYPARANWRLCSCRRDMIFGNDLT
jgi:hypothetical protein